MKTDKPDLSRRDFMRTSAVASGMAAMATLRMAGAHAAGSDTIRVGMIGCGGRGTGAAVQCVQSSPGVEIVAMGDLFKDKLDSSLERMTKKLGDKAGDLLKVPADRQFVGFDAYKKVCACEDVNLIVTAAPPGFRPIHLEAAIKAGKHVFMEKPVAVDPVGIRSVMASSELASQKGLGIVAGTQRRHQKVYLEIMKRIQDGAIGEVVGGQCYWNSGNLWHDRVEDNWKHKEEWSDMEWQCRNWLFTDWLSGDHICEQHIHNLDVMNWAMGSHPIQVMGMGGRQVRTEAKWGNIFDHFAVEYLYPNGARVMSTCRQTDGCSTIVAERVVGTKGVTYTDGGVGRIEGANAYKFEGDSPDPYVQEHADLIASIRKGEPLNEGKRVAESTLTAIIGRMSAYTGRAMKWDWVLNQSKLDLVPKTFEFGDLALNPVPVPGKTKLV